MYSDLVLCTTSNTLRVVTYSELYFSGLFKHIQGYSGLVRHIHSDWDLLRHIQAYSGIFMAPWHLFVAQWCSGYDYCTTSFNKAWTQVLCIFKSYPRCVRDSRLWGSLTMAPAGNKAKHLLSVNYTAKAIHYNHHHHIQHLL